MIRATRAKSSKFHCLAAGLLIGLLPALAFAECVIDPGTPPASDSSPFCVDAPALPPVSTLLNQYQIVNISSETALQDAVGALSNNTVLLLAPGVYNLSNTLWINNRDNVIIRGDSDNCDDVVLVGNGMENASGSSSVPHGIWTNSNGLKVQNLTIGDVYFHTVAIDSSANAPELYNVRLVDSGEQFIKSSSGGFGNGADTGRVEYSVMEYSVNPPNTDHGGGGTGYTNGVDVHGGNGWVIRNNRFKNFHTPDSAQNLWNPAVLMWNGARNTLVENNTFIDVDRAIAFGLANRANDHRGGIIRNNMIVMSQGLYSNSRKPNSDATIIIWNSPDSRVLHNSIATQGNLNKAIELRFTSNNVQVRHRAS